jgi:hypothetical protein
MSQNQSSTGGSASATGGSSESSSSSYSSTTTYYGHGVSPTQCPEISASGAAAGLTILLMGLAIAMGRRRKV